MNKALTNYHLLPEFPAEPSALLRKPQNPSDCVHAVSRGMNSLKPLIIPLVESYSFPETPHEHSRLDSVVSSTEQKVLQEILEADDNWLKLCSLYLIAKIKNFEYIPSLKSLTKDSDIRVQEMAEFALMLCRKID